jgi:hypothetical protein
MSSARAAAPRRTEVDQNTVTVRRTTRERAITNLRE